MENKSIIYICRVKLTILGCNSAVPTLQRRTTAQILNLDEQYSLIDCGEGTQIQLGLFGLSHFKIRHIFISHLHGDHYFGLIGLLNSMGLAGREKPLQIFAPPKLMDIMYAHMDPIGRSLPFEIEFTPIAEGESVTLIDTDKLKVTAFPTEHSIPCHGFRFDQHKPKRKLLPERAEELGVPVAYFQTIKNGKDYVREDGSIVSYMDVTAPLDFTNYSYAFAADTAYTEDIIPHIHGVHTLYHEATYTAEQSDKALLRKHSTSTQAANIALQADVQRLILGHYSSAYRDVSIFQEEASSIFPNTELSEDGKQFDWPPQKAK